MNSQPFKGFFKMCSSAVWLYILYIVFVCLEVSGKGTVFSCVGEYCMKRDSPLTKQQDDDEKSRQYIICSDDGKGDISCNYASKEDAAKDSTIKTQYIESSNKETINPALAAGDTSDIVDDEPEVVSNNTKNDTATKLNDTTPVIKNTTQKLEKINNTRSGNDTKNVTQPLKVNLTKPAEEKLNLTLNDTQVPVNDSQNGILWVFSKILDWWSVGYNGVWNVLKAGKCPMPWLTSTRLHCNAVEGDEASWTVMAVSFALFPVMGYICLIRV